MPACECLCVCARVWEERGGARRTAKPRWRRRRRARTVVQQQHPRLAGRRAPLVGRHEGAQRVVRGRGAEEADNARGRRRRVQAGPGRGGGVDGVERQRDADEHRLLRDVDDGQGEERPGGRPHRRLDVGEAPILARTKLPLLPARRVRAAGWAQCACVSQGRTAQAAARRAGAGSAARAAALRLPTAATLQLRAAAGGRAAERRRTHRRK